MRALQVRLRRMTFASSRYEPFNASDDDLCDIASACLQQMQIVVSSFHHASDNKDFISRTALLFQIFLHLIIPGHSCNLNKDRNIVLRSSFVYLS
jgi:hypothetical protein